MIEIPCIMKHSLMICFDLLLWNRGNRNAPRNACFSVVMLNFGLS